MKYWSVCDGPRVCKQKPFTVVFHQGQECPSPSGLHLLLLLLALFQEGRWLEFLLLLGRRLARWTVWGADRWFGRWSSRRRGGVVRGQGLHPFFQLFRHLLVLLTSVLDDCRDGLQLPCPRKKHTQEKKNKISSQINLWGCGSYQAKWRCRWTCLPNESISVSFSVLTSETRPKQCALWISEGWHTKGQIQKEKTQEMK